MAASWTKITEGEFTSWGCWNCTWKLLTIGILLCRIRGCLPRLVARRVHASRDIVPRDAADVRVADDESILTLGYLESERLVITCRPSPSSFAWHVDAE